MPRLGWVLRLSFTATPEPVPRSSGWCGRGPCPQRGEHRHAQGSLARAGCRRAVRTPLRQETWHVRGIAGEGFAFSPCPARGLTQRSARFWRLRSDSEVLTYGRAPRSLRAAANRFQPTAKSQRAGEAPPSPPSPAVVCVQARSGVPDGDRLATGERRRTPARAARMRSPPCEHTKLMVSSCARVSPRADWTTLDSITQPPRRRTLSQIHTIRELSLHYCAKELSQAIVGQPIDWVGCSVSRNAHAMGSHV